MFDEKSAFALNCPEHGAPTPVLTGVAADGRLDGVLFEMILRQTYRNESERVLEVVYTFPLPLEAVLLGFATELNGQRKQGAIVEKRQAERTYETALAKGDAPVMLEVAGDGLHTANIGNLKPGEQMVLEVRYGQLLRLEQGRLRLSIPTTIAPRYGNPGHAGLQPQQVPAVSLVAEYPLSLALTIAGSLGNGSVECPTHTFVRTRADGALRLELDAGARLDRDVVIVLTPREVNPSVLVRGQDPTSSEAPVVLMAALQVPPAPERPHTQLKLLVDCSGSMGGDSMASARRALAGVVQVLREGDTVSLSRFGSTVEHALAPCPITTESRARLQSFVDAAEANLGGTEMEAALRAVFALKSGTEGKDAQDVLLITDGEIWNTDATVQAARASGHRLFVIGVGTSPAESVIRKMAEATAGACEFATPGEALEAASARMLARIRQQARPEASIDWGVPTEWASGPTSALFSGDTVIAFAGVKRGDRAVMPRLVMPAASGAQELARCEADAPAAGDTLARMAAARRMAACDEPAQALQLALTYRLMSKQTHCVLVHERADADKTQEQAELHRVSSMLAAAWGGTSTVRDAVMRYSVQSVKAFRAGFSSPSILQQVRSAMVAPIDAECSDSTDAIAMPCLRRTAGDDIDGRATLRAIAQLMIDALRSGGEVDLLPSHSARQLMHPEVYSAIGQLIDVGFTDAEAWLLLTHWVVKRIRAQKISGAAETLRPLVDLLPLGRINQAVAILRSTLGSYAVDSWDNSRAARMMRSMQRQVD